PAPLPARASRPSERGAGRGRSCIRRGRRGDRRVRRARLMFPKRVRDSRPAPQRPRLADQPAATGYGSVGTALGRVTLYLLWNLLMVPVQAVAVVVSKRAAMRIPVFYHRNCLRAMGTKVTRHGRIE